MPAKKQREEEDEMSTEETMEETIEGYKTALKIGNKLFGNVSLAQARELFGLMDDDLDEEECEVFEDELRECQEKLLTIGCPVTFDDVVGLYVDTFLGDVD